MSERIVIVKLVTGETLLANLLNETPETIIIEKPVSLKTIQANSPEGLIERTVTSPFCSLTQDEEFVLDSRHVLYIANLHPAIIGMYYKLILAFDDEYESLLSSIDNVSNMFESDEYTEEDHEDELFLITPDTKTVH